MKTLKFLILIALTSTLASVVVHTQDRIATYALRGPVRTFRTEVATFALKDGNYVEGPRVVQMEASFNTDGNRTDLYLYNDQGILSRRIEMKFDGQKMTECINYDGLGKIWLRIVDVYDNEGRIKEEINYNGDGSLHSKTTFKRNDRGQLIESTEYTAAGVLLEQKNNRYEGVTLHSSERKLYRSDGTLQSTELYVAPNRRDTIIYRPDGSVANKSVRIGQEIASYNADGSLQKVTTISDQGRLLDELNLSKTEATTRESQIPDQIDAHGNWTRQTKWFVNANGSRPLKVTYRAITYYEN